MEVQFDASVFVKCTSRRISIRSLLECKTRKFAGHFWDTLINEVTGEQNAEVVGQLLST